MEMNVFEMRTSRVGSDKLVFVILEKKVACGIGVGVMGREKGRGERTNIQKGGSRILEGGGGPK